MSSDGPLRAELLRFISEVADSVETIEVLAILVASSPGWLTAERVAEQLKTSERYAALRLAHLAVAGIATSRGRFYRYGPVPTDRAALVLELLRTYKTHRARVIEAVVNRPTNAG